MFFCQWRWNSFIVSESYVPPRFHFSLSSRYEEIQDSMHEPDYDNGTGTGQYDTLPPNLNSTISATAHYDTATDPNPIYGMAAAGGTYAAPIYSTAHPAFDGDSTA